MWTGASNGMFMYLDPGTTTWCWVIDNKLAKSKDNSNQVSTSRKLVPAQACERDTQRQYPPQYPPSRGWVGFTQGKSDILQQFDHSSGEVVCSQFAAQQLDGESGPQSADGKSSTGIAQPELVTLLVLIILIWGTLVACRMHQARGRTRLLSAARNRRGLVEITIFSDEDRAMSTTNTLLPVVTAGDGRGNNQKSAEQRAEEVMIKAHAHTHTGYINT